MRWYRNSFAVPDESVLGPIVSYGLKDEYEFQAVLIQLRARGVIKKGSALWKLTEEILDLIEEAQL